MADRADPAGGETNDSSESQPPLKLLSEYTLKLDWHLEALNDISSDSKELGRIKVPSDHLPDILHDGSKWKAYLKVEDDWLTLNLQRHKPDTQKEDIYTKVKLTVKNGAYFKFFESGANDVTFPKDQAKMIISWEILHMKNINSRSNLGHLRVDLDISIYKQTLDSGEHDPNGPMENFVNQFVDGYYDERIIQIVGVGGQAILMKRNELIRVSKYFEELLDPDIANIQLNRLVLDDLDLRFLNTLKNFIEKQSLPPGLTAGDKEQIRSQAIEYKVYELVALCNTESEKPTDSPGFLA